MIMGLLSLGLLIYAACGVVPAQAQTSRKSKRPRRPTPPARDPHTPGFVQAKELPDGAVPPANQDGNFILGPSHPAARESSAQKGVPEGTIFEFTMLSSESRFYPGIAREADTYGTPDPHDPAKMIVTTSHP